MIQTRSKTYTCLYFWGLDSKAAKFNSASRKEMQDWKIVKK